MFFIPIIVFILFDYISFRLRRKDIPESKREELIEKTMYFPNLRIWGLGLIVGIGSILMKYHSSIEIHLKGGIFEQLGAFGFILCIVGFMLIAIVKIIKED